MKQELKQKTVGITLTLSADANVLLNTAVRKSKRTKRAEGNLRLEDHLLRFPSIAELSKSKGSS